MVLPSKIKPPKTVLITGCSGGIGYCTAHILRQNGWQVFAGVRKVADQKRLEAEGFSSILLDLIDSNSIEAAVTNVLLATEGQLSALINNAGFGQPGAVEDINRDALRQQFETNVFGLQELTNRILPIMRKQGYGRIVNISSVLGLVSMAYRGAYSASKFAVEALTDALRLELAGSGVTVSLIEPGPIKSDFRNNARAAYNQHIHAETSSHQKVYDRMLDQIEHTKQNSRFTLPPEAVAKKILHALESESPKIRYYVTAPTYLLAFLKRILPGRGLDWLMRKVNTT